MSEEKRVVIEMSGTSGSIVKIVKSTLPVDLIVVEEGGARKKKEVYTPAGI